MLTQGFGGQLLAKSWPLKGRDRTRPGDLCPAATPCGVRNFTGSFASAGKGHYTPPSQIHARVPAFPYETGRAGTISR